MKTLTNIIYPAFALFAFACFAFSGTAAAAPPSNVSLGPQALQNNTTGTNDTALGYQAMKSNTTGGANTATGSQALFNNTTGLLNTADGSFALYYNTTGSQNAASGSYALFSNTTGAQNTATGAGALQSNTTGFFNTAVGDTALQSNTTGDRNTAFGSRALIANTTGQYNTGIGRSALFFNTTGTWNLGVGIDGGQVITTGSRNTAIGSVALPSNSTGNFNTALGYGAGYYLTGDNNIDIAALGVAAEANTIRIGQEVAATDDDGVLHPAHTATYIAGISGQTASGGVAVYINSDGQLGTLTSSARLKKDIKPMDKASEMILALKPVTFRYKQEIDPKGIPQFGLVAEDVEKVNPDLVVRDADGKPYTVRYEAVNAMLLNEFLKEHRKVEQLTQDFESKLAEQQKQIEALTSGLQKVSAQIEVSRPAPQVVENRQ